MAAAIDLFPGPAGRALGYDSPATHAQPTTGDDANDLTYVSRALAIGTGGAVKVTTRGDSNYAGETVVLTLPAGVIPLRVSRVWSAGLTAVGVTALT